MELTSVILFMMYLFVSSQSKWFITAVDIELWNRLSKGMLRSHKVRVLERVIESLGLREIRNSLVGTVEKRAFANVANLCRRGSGISELVGWDSR